MEGGYQYTEKHSYGKANKYIVYDGYMNIML